MSPASWRSAGLRHNPFAYVSVAQEARLSLVDLVPVERFLAHTKEAWVIQWIGPHGWGKTTQMRAMWAQLFAGAPFVQARHGERVKGLGDGATVAFLDGAEVCTWWQRRRLWRDKRTNWVISTHRDFSAEMRRAGRVVWERRPEAVEVGWLEQVVRRRVAHAALDGSEDALCVEREALEHLIAVHGGHLREMVRVLYFAAQRLEDGGSIGLEDVMAVGAHDPKGGER